MEQFKAMRYFLLLLLFLISCIGYERIHIQVNYTEDSIALIDSTYYIEKVTVENNYIEAPFLSMTIKENVIGLKKIFLDNIDFSIYEVNGSLSNACKNPDLYLSVWARSQTDTLDKQYFSVYFNCEIDTIVTVLSEGRKLP